MDRLLAMSVFAKVVELGSFARAADRLGLSSSAVSRHVSDLEKHLHTRLLQRTTRRLSLTEAGQGFHRRCVQLLADLEDAESSVGAAGREARGTIRLTTSMTFGVRHLSPAISAFVTRHPAVSFDVSLSDHFVDLIEEGIDLAVRIGHPGSQHLVARKIGEARLIACAAPAYLKRHGVPRTPEELAEHNCLAYRYLQARGTWAFRDRQGRDRSVRVSGDVQANNGDLLAAVAAHGRGIALEPEFIVGPDLRSGRLVRILEGFTAPTASVHAVYPSRRHLPAKVRVFIDFLVERFAGARGWAA